MVIDINKLESGKEKRKFKIYGKITPAVDISDKEENIPGKTCILKLSGVWVADRETGNDSGNKGFGSEEAEDRCDEIRQLIDVFPETGFWRKEVWFDYVKVNKTPGIYFNNIKLKMEPHTIAIKQDER